MTMSSAADRHHVDAGEYIDVLHFLHREARLLDEGRYEEWLELVTDDIVYEMPLTMTREAGEHNHRYDSVMQYFSENLASLQMRIRRIRTDYAWAEDPPTRTRHFLSNVEAYRRAEDPDSLDVRCAFVVYANRGTQTDWDQLVGHRRDVLVRHEVSWRLARRTLYLDQAVLGTNSISVLL